MKQKSRYVCETVYISILNTAYIEIQTHETFNALFSNFIVDYANAKFSEI